MKSILLDTSTVVAYFRDRLDLFGLAGDRQLFMSLISIGELLKGAIKSNRPKQNRAAIDELLKRVAVLHPGEDTAEMYARISVGLQAKGRPIPENDVWIAAAALEVGLPLVCRDGHFGEIEGLTVLRW